MRSITEGPREVQVLLSSELSSAHPVSLLTSWPPRIKEFDLEDGVSFHKLRSGSVHTASQTSRVARARARYFCF